MSRLYKRNNSPHWWYSSGTPPHRIRISLKTTNKKTAQEIAKELDKKYTFDKFGIPTTLSVNFVTGLSIYYDKVVSAKGESWSRKIKSQLNSFREYIGDPELLSINGGMVEDYKNELLRSQAPKTTRDKITTLKNFFDYCILKGFMHTNPCTNIVLPTKKPVNPRKPVPISAIKEAINLADRKVDKLFWQVLLYTQLRVVDAGSLTKDDIKTGLVQRKNRNPLPLYIPKHLKKENLVMLCNTKTKQRTSLGKYKDIMYQLGYKTTDFHSIRHSVSTFLLSKNYSMEDIKIITGHSSTAVHSYVHPGRKELVGLLSNI